MRSYSPYSETYKLPCESWAMPVTKPNSPGLSPLLPPSLRELALRRVEQHAVIVRVGHHQVALAIEA